MNPVIQTLNGAATWDYRIRSFDGWTLVLGGGTTIDYPDNWTVQIEFTGVKFIQCPTDFSYPRFREPSSSETDYLSATVALEPGDLLVAIDAECEGSLGDQTFFIVAESANVRE